MIKKSIKIIIGLLGLVVCCTAWADEVGQGDKIEPVSTDNLDAIRVTTEPLSALVFQTEYSAPANVVSLNDSSISAELQGRAIKVRVEVGDTVKRGQLLVEIDCRSYINAKKQAMASLNLSKSQLIFSRKQFNRNQRLLQRGVLPRETFDRSEAELLTSRAEISLKEVAIESADLSISKCKIFAPFKGQVTNKFVQQGQLVNPGSTLIQLLQTDKLEIEAQLSPLELDKARSSKPLKFVSGTSELTVTIRTVLKQLSKMTNTQQVRLSAQTLNTDTVFTGLNGRLIWKDGSRKIRPEYIIRRNDKLGVMVAKDDKAMFHELENAREGQPANVNLPNTSQIIVVNRYSVEDGQAVVVQ